MRTIVFSTFVFVTSIICLSKSENSTENTHHVTGSGDALVTTSINYNLIADKVTETNKFEISYEVTYGEFVFKRFEKCRVLDSNQTQELFCSGRTNFVRTGDAKNVTNFDEYTYSSNGFNHTGETFKVSGNFYRVNAIDLIYGLEADAITLKPNVTQAMRELQFDRVGENHLNVNFNINSTYFAMNRTEIFSVDTDEETDTNDLTCVGHVTIIVRNSDDYHTVQKEAFTLGEDYSFAYVSEAEFFNINGTSTDNHDNGTEIELTVITSSV